MRRLLVVVQVLGFLVGGLGAPARAAPTQLQILLDSRLAEFSGGAAIVVRDGTTGELLYARDPDELIVAASLYKLGILLEAERRVDGGQLRYEDRIVIEPEDITEDGSFFWYGTVLTIDEALEAAITLSDNGSALALQRIFTTARINATLRDLGIQPFSLWEDPRDDNAASARAVATFFTLLAQRKLVSAPASDRMLKRLGRQQINDRLPAQLPPGTLVAHKTGNLGFVTHDAGIVYRQSGEPVVVVAMTWDASEDEAIELIQDLGSLVYAHVVTDRANVGYGLPQLPVSAAAGRTIVQSVKLTNLGPGDWRLDPADVLRLEWDMTDASGRVVARSVNPIRLWDVKAGASIEVPVVLPVPSSPGDYRLGFSLSDQRHGALAPLGTATASMTLRVHDPYLVDLGVQLSPLLHREEASAAVVTLAPTADLVEAALLRLGWRALDPRNGRVLAQGSAPLAEARPGRRITTLVPLVAPSLRGTYLLEIFALSDGHPASDVIRKTVVIAGARTYPGELVEGAGHAAPPPPRGTPRPSPGKTPSGKTPGPGTSR